MDKDAKAESECMNNVDIMILGAGIAGLGAAYKAKELGRSAVVFEANSRAGGLLDNFEVEGFRFDNAVHLSFANEPEVRTIFDQTPFYTHPADALNFDQDRWLKHPVQNNLFPLPADDKVSLVKSFIERPDTLAGDDYESWLRHQYGHGIAERYPLKYTQKYWGTPASKLSTTWIGNRMRRAELEEILYGSYSSDTPNTYYTKEMRYPMEGGYKAFIQPLIDQAEICKNHRATQIDLQNKTVTFNESHTVRYEKLINTLPLPLFIELCQNVPNEVRQAASSLTATSIDLISVGFNKPIINDLWFYIYDEDIHPSRAYSPSVKSPENVPEGCSSLQFEAYSRGRESTFSADELKQNVLYSLEKMQIAAQKDILFIHHKHLPWGNVIFDIGMEENKEIVKSFLKSKSITSCGRFGEWDYLWSNQSLISGFKAAQQLIENI